MLKAAEPPESAPEPSRVAPSKKFTVPDGVPPTDVTDAVRTTVPPKVEGLGAEAKLVAVGAGFTV